MIDMLIEYGADVNVQNIKGQTRLHLAAITGNESLLLKLCRAPGHVFSQNVTNIYRCKN